MSTTPTADHCPQCGAPVPAAAAHGLCPKCLLASAATPTPSEATAQPHPAPTLEAVQAAFPQLEIRHLIGSGGMGTVYQARQPKLDRFVALKLLPEPLAKDPAFAERFGREARLLARLNHANIVTVYDFGQAGGFFYLLMEYVDGVNLRQAMQAGRFTPPQALAIVPRICEALQFAHDEGILHRDIKPENILLDAKGRVKIADFGIAKLLGEEAKDLNLTASGVAVGTPNYMAPEQIERPQDVDQRADIYSLGVVFYEMLTGELPIGRFAPPSQKVATDPRVDEVVLRTLEKERDKRYRTATEVKTRVEELQTPPPAGAPDHAATAPAGQVPPPVGGTVVMPRARPSRRWSVKAIVGAALVGVSALPVLFIAVILGFAVGRRGGGLGLFEVLLLLTPAMLLGLAGTILGMLALSDLRHATEPLRGRWLALMAALAWPLLILNLLMLAFGAAVLRFSAASTTGGLPIPAGIGLAGAAGLLVALNILLLLAARRWIKPSRQPSVDRPPATRHGVWFWGLLLLGAVLLLPMLGVLGMLSVWHSARHEQRETLPRAGSAALRPATGIQAYNFDREHNTVLMTAVLQQADEEIHFFAGEENSGWFAGSRMIRQGRFAIAVEPSEAIPLGDGRTGQGFVIRIGRAKPGRVTDYETTTNVAVGPGNPLPAGKFVGLPRPVLNGTGRTGYLTFANLVTPEGNRIPLHVQVRSRDSSDP